MAGLPVLSCVISLLSLTLDHNLFFFDRRLALLLDALTAKSDDKSSEEELDVSLIAVVAARTAAELVDHDDSFDDHSYRAFLVLVFGLVFDFFFYRTNCSVSESIRRIIECVCVNFGNIC